jgi:1-acyl-sn-glycerol-3-phosphate acyltransferase
LPVPQSTSFAHTEKLSPRELARKATESFQAAHDVMCGGYSLLLYPEGSRSRTGHLGPFLKGVHRYLSCVEGLSVVPMAIAGTERVMPIDQSKLHPGHVALRFGPSLVVGTDGSSREILETARRAVAELLPEPLRPLAGTDATA